MGKAGKAKPERDQEIFKLKEQEDWTFPMLAAKFKISEKRVKDLYYRELKKRGMKPKRDRKK